MVELVKTVKCRAWRPLGVAWTGGEPQLPTCQTPASIDDYTWAMPVLTYSRASSVPRLEAVRKASSVVPLMPSRRDSPTAWSAFADLVEELRPQHAVFIDKTVGHEASDFLTPRLSRLDSNVIVLRRPHDEDPFHSIADLRVTKELYVLQLHDDDSWQGVPEVSSNSRNAPVLLSPIQKGDAANGVGIDPHLSRFFGAIRGDIWCRFMRHCMSHEPRTSPTIDQTLSFLLAAIGGEAILSNYAYTYDNSNWSTWSAIASNNAVGARSMGWRTQDFEAAIHWSHLLDDLEVLTSFRDLLSDMTMAQVLSARLTNPANPKAPGKADFVWRALPPVVRVAVARSRGTGRGLVRVREVLVRCLNRDLSSNDLTLLGGYGPVSLQTIRDSVIPALRSWAEPSLTPRLQRWDQCVRGLASSHADE